MFRFKELHIWGLIVYLMFAAFSCEERGNDKSFTIGFSQCGDDAWRQIMNSEMYRELSFHPEVDITIRVADWNNELQEKQIRELVDLGIDLLIVSPNESEALTPVIEEVFNSGIPVILIDRETDSKSYTAFIGGDNYEIGRTAGEYIVNQLNGKGKILELQISSKVSPGYLRSKGFRDVIQDYPEMEVVAETEIMSIDIELKPFLDSVFQSGQELDVVYSHTDQIAEHTYIIAEGYGYAENLFFVGVDGIPGTGRGIQAVEDGILDASMLYRTGGSEAIRLAIAILNDLPFEKQNLLPTTVIDSSNARILHQQIKRVNSLQENIDNQIQQLEQYNTLYRNQRLFIFILISSLLLAIILGGNLWLSLKAKQRINQDLSLKNKEVIEKQQQLMEMSEKIQEVTKAKMDFFTHISHEFRTPLTLILSFIEDLFDSPKKNKKEDIQAVGLIKQNALRLLRLVNQLMDFRKMESGQMKLRASENDLVAFLRGVMTSFEKLAEKKHIDFNLLTRSAHIPLWFDVNMMDKVFFNILSNAYKFTPENGKVTISVSIDHFANVVNILVEDSGIGMSDQEMEHIFEAFYQGEHNVDFGTGLGLPFSKSLIELHRGDINVKSSKGKGTRFIIGLPMGKAHFTEDQLVQEAADLNNKEELVKPLEQSNEGVAFKEPNGQARQKEQSLLLIEDNKDILFLLRKKLGSTYTILEASDGDMGLELAFEHIPDLIISDIMLPGQDGLEITKRLKSDLRTSHIPIILLTARSNIEKQIEGARAGADAYITKPFNMELLKEKIKNLFHNRQILKESFGNKLLSFDQQSNLSAIDQEFIKNFSSYLESNYMRQDFQVTDLCQQLQLSRSQLYRKVKALLGQSISDCIQSIRLEKAEMLLLAGQLSISEIAYQVGYTSPDYFSTVFKSKYNIAPSQYKKQKFG